MIAISLADTDLVRRATERLHQFDTQAVAGRLRFDTASQDEVRHYDLVSTITHRRLVCALVIARGAAMA